MIAVDLLKFDPLQGVEIIKGDISSSKVQEEIFKKSDYTKFDVICSDACPEFVGVKDTDICRSFELNNLIFKQCFKFLKIEGHLILKVFESSEYNKLHQDLKQQFKSVYKFKPSSSRTESSEIYSICLGFRPSKEKLQEKLDSERQLLIKQEKSKSKSAALSSINPEFNKLNDDFEKLLADPKKQPNDSEKADKKANKLHVKSIIESKMEEISFQHTKIKEIEKLIEDENQIARLRENDLQENKVLSNFVRWDEREQNEEIIKQEKDDIKPITEEFKGKLMNNVCGLDLEKNIERQHEQDKRRLYKQESNKKEKKERDKANSGDK